MMRPLTQDERDAAIRAAHQNGRTYQQISDQYELTRGRIQQIVTAPHKRYRKIEEGSELTRWVMQDLSAFYAARLLGAFNRMGLTTLDELCGCDPRELRKQPGFGRKTWLYLRKRLAAEGRELIGDEDEW